jgi:hypothetical protein
MNSVHICDGSPRIPGEVTALISVLQLREPNTANLRDLSDREWSDLLDFCDLAHLALPLAKLLPDTLPHWVIERLGQNVIDNAHRFKRVKSTYKEVAEVLSQVGVDYIVIKGFTQCPSYIELPKFRVQSDLDLYCPTKIELAKIALEEIGYKSAKGTGGGFSDHTLALIRPGKWRWNGNHYDPEMPLSIELHFCLWNERTSLLSLPEIDAFWERRTIRSLEDISFPCLSHVDQLSYLALHIVRNVLLRDWVIHHVYELALFLHARASDDSFWENWSRTNDASLRSIEAIAFYFAQAWFNCDLHQQVQNEIANIKSAQQQWLHRFAVSTLEVMFRQNKDSFWLHLSLLESIKAKRALIKRFFIPTTISSVTTPGMAVQNRRPRLPSKLHPYLQYLGYLAMRGTSYSYINLTTVLRGLIWRISCQ